MGEECSFQVVGGEMGQFMGLVSMVLNLIEMFKCPVTRKGRGGERECKEKVLCGKK